MNLVDSSGWLEYFSDGQNADFFAPAIENTQELIISTINIYEVFKKILQQRTEDEAMQAISVMQQGKIIELSNSLALDAAKLSIIEKLPFADSIILATAKANQAILWTQDSDFKGIEDVKFIEKN